MIACLALAVFSQGAPEVPSGDSFAESIAAGSDLDGDGVSDLVIADDTLHDGVDVWFVSGRDGSVLARRTAADANAVYPVDRVGDVDGDGIADFAVGMMLGGRSCRVELLSGRNADVLRSFEGKDEDDRVFPGSIRAVDVDGDGTRDLVLCGVRTMPLALSTVSILQLSGKDGRRLARFDGQPADRTWTFSGPVGIGDIDQDGREDFGVSPTDISGGATVRLISGKNGSTLRSLNAGNQQLVSSIDGGADVDGDGHIDVLVGVCGDWNSGDVGGRVCIYSGADGALLRTVLGREVVGPSSEKEVGGSSWDLVESFGETARFVPDVDGDGTPDLLVGAPEIIGVAYLCSGKTGARIRAFPGQFGPFDADGRDRGQYHVGRALAAAGDVDGDGVGDLAIASVPYGGNGFGCVRVFSGHSGNLLLSVDRESLLRSKPGSSESR